MYIADTLSHATVSRGDDNKNSCDERVVYAMEATYALSEETLSQLKKATAADCVLQVVCEKRERLANKKEESGQGTTQLLAIEGQ